MLPTGEFELSGQLVHSEAPADRDRATMSATANSRRAIAVAYTPDVLITDIQASIVKLDTLLSRGISQMSARVKAFQDTLVD